MTTERPTCVIVTPAFTEAAYRTHDSERRASDDPASIRWVIVDDGSTQSDGRDRPAAKGPAVRLMRYLRRERVPGQTYYASNVYALLAGYEAAATCRSYLAISEDIVLCDRYYEEVFHRLEMNRDMGIAAGWFARTDQRKAERIEWTGTPPESISGLPSRLLRAGGGTSRASMVARTRVQRSLARNGWKTWSFPDIQAIHLKPLGTAGGRHVLVQDSSRGWPTTRLSTHPPSCWPSA